MSNEFDFEQYWLNKFSNSLENIAGKDIKKKIIVGSEKFNDKTSVEEVFSWSKKAMEKLESLVDGKK